MTLVHYALVDRAVLPGILDWVEEEETQVWCLFAAPVEEDFALVAPYLVRLTPAFEQRLSVQNIPWGFLLTSTEAPKALVAHCRQLLSINVEGKAAPIFCRYYDPRVLWRLYDALTLPQQTFFTQRMMSIQTNYPEVRVLMLSQRPMLHQAPLHLTLSRQQYLSMTQSMDN